MIRRIDYNLAIGDEGFVVLTTSSGLVRYMEPPFELHVLFDVPKNSDMVELDFPARLAWSSPQRSEISDQRARAIEENIREALRVLGWSPRDRA